MDRAARRSGVREARKPKGKKTSAKSASPAARPHKKRPKATSRHDECRAAWTSRKHDPDHGGGDWLLDKPDLPMDAGPFLATLRRLGYITRDQRYTELHRELVYGGMIDAKGNWSRYGTVLAQPDTRLLCEMIEQNIAMGISEREVLAEAVVAFNIEAATFRAAVEQVRALLHEYRKTVSEKNRLNF